MVGPGAETGTTVPAAACKADCRHIPWPGRGTATSMKVWASALAGDLAPCSRVNAATRGRGRSDHPGHRLGRGHGHNASDEDRVIRGTWWIYTVAWQAVAV
ncbi:hypothetical protein GCM10020220_068920 [Nonomuraea rubra]